MFILGKLDYEMRAIREILRYLRIKYCYASYDGKHLDTKNQYIANGTLGNIDMSKESKVFSIECNGDELARNSGYGGTVIMIDHHREGDYGYGAPPEDYWAASSIGQVVKVLSDILLYDISFLKKVVPYARIIAASDHCLPYAYSGACGISPESIMLYRVQVISSSEMNSPETIEKELQKSEEKIERLDSVEFRGIEFKFLGNSYVHRLNESACRSGIPVIFSTKHKLKLVGATYQEIHEFKNWSWNNPKTSKFLENTNAGYAECYHGKGSRLNLRELS